MTDNKEFVESVKQDELDEQVYVFTPKGKIVDMPLGSTPVDFAYRIHSKVGESCTGAKVNNRIVPLDYQLQNGEICEILTVRTPRGPSRDWLNFVKTSGARNHIRRYFNRLRRDENVAAGRTELEKEFKRLGLVAAFEDVAQSHGVRTVEDLFAQIGSGELIARQVAQKLLAQQVRQEQERAAEQMPAPTPARPRREPKGLHVRGVDGVLTRIARCCSPVAGEPIVGYVTRGRGVTVHRADCRTIINERDKGRLLEVSWGAPEKGQGYSVPVQIESWDRVGLWRDVSAVVADAGINIESVKQVPQRRQGRALLEVILTIHTLAQLTMILDKISRLPNIIEARRVGTSAA